MTRYVWEIEPHHSSSDFDACVLPGNTQEDHRAALAYAKDRLEDVWDRLEIGETGTVKLKRRIEDPDDPTAPDPEDARP